MWGGTSEPVWKSRLSQPFVLSPSTPFVLSLSKQRTVLRAGLSKDERTSSALVRTLIQSWAV